MNDRYQKFFKDVIREHTEGVPVKGVNDRVLLFDGLNTFIRVFSAVPALNDDGDHIGGVTGFLRSIASVIKRFKPTRCIIIFDGKGGSQRRRKLFPDYKGNRAVKTKFNRYNEFETADDEHASMRRQYTRLSQYLDYLPVTLMVVDRVEADDIIAYIANEVFTKDNEKVEIVSTDRDFLQLVNHRISVWSPIKKIYYTPDVMKEEFGFIPKNYLLYRAFIGDPSDNIPGVKGVGLKTILKHFPDFANQPYTIDRVVKESIDKQQEQPKAKMFEKICSAESQLYLNDKLMQLKDTDMSGNIKLNVIDRLNTNINESNILEFKKMFMRDKMYSVIKDVDSFLAAFASLNAYAKMHNND
jgi:DNA polymerase-1